MTEIKTKKVKLHNVGMILILSIVTILYFAMLVAGDE